MIAFEVVSFGYGKTMILHQFSWSFNGFGLIMLTGDSGSGKTTFLKLLRGKKPQHGSVRILHQTLYTLSNHRRLAFYRAHIGNVNQQPTLLEEATVYEMIHHMMRLKHVTRFPKAWFTTYLADLTITQRLSSLSRGQKQRLALLLATLGDPEILLLDEPLDGLDDDNIGRIVALLSDLKKAQLIVVATHHLEAMASLCDEQLHFPLPSRIGQQLDRNKLSPNVHHLRPLTRPFTFSFLWSYHQRKARREGQGFGFFVMSFTLSLLLGFFSTTLFLGDTFVQWSQTMLGGQYTYVEPMHQQELKVVSFTPDNQDMVAAMKPFGHLETHYDTQFFDRYFPTTSGYVDHMGYKRWLPGVQLHGFNTYQHLAWSAPAPFRDLHLSDYQVVLGLPRSTMAHLAQHWGVFPTFASVQSFLSLRAPLIFFDLEQPDWRYVNQIAFEFVGIIESEQPQFFHSLSNYTEHVYETMLRFPSRWLQDDAVYPWEIVKTMRLKTNQTNEFIDTYVSMPTFHTLEIEKLNTYAFALFLSNRNVSFQRPPHDALWTQTGLHSLKGYHYLPLQWMHGFALPTLWGSNITELRDIQAQFKGMPLEQWLSTNPPPDVMRGHAFLGAQQSVHLTITNTHVMPINGIYISETLARRFAVRPQDVLYVMIEIESNVFEVAFDIIGIMDSQTLSVYQHPLWWERIMLNLIGQHSLELQPLGYAYFGETMLTINGWSITSPFVTIQQTVHHVQTIFVTLLGILFLGLFVPLTFMLFLNFHRAFIVSIPSLSTLLSYGFSFKDVLLSRSMHTLYVLTQLLWQTLLVFLPLDVMIQYQLHELLYQSFTWRIPFESLISLFVMLWFMFYVYRLMTKQGIAIAYKKLL